MPNVSEQKHSQTQTQTPGPWEWRQLGNRWVLWGRHSDRPIVMDFVRSGMQGAAPRVRVGGIMRPFDPDHPDARLLEATPDLLEALAICEIALLAIQQGTLAPGADETALEYARAAIKKAMAEDNPC